MRDERLTIEAKGIYAYLSAFAGNTCQAFPSVELMVKELGISAHRYFKHLKILKDTGYVRVEKRRDEKGYLSGNLYILLVKPESLHEENLHEENLHEENLHEENLHTNNNSINNNSINNNNNKNIYSRAEPDHVEKNNNNSKLAKEIIDYLNLKANKKFKPTTPKTKQLINARLNESFSKDDFLKVIDTKCKSWLGTEWERYLRPETLFGTKFESYLNEEVKDGYSIKSDTRKDDEQAKEWDIDGLIFTGE